MRFKGVRTAWRFLRRPRVFDTALVIALGGFSLTTLAASLLGGNLAVPALTPLIMTVSAVFLLYRRDRPIMVVAAAAGLDMINIVVASASTAGLIAMIALYSVGRHASGRKVWITAGVTAVVYGTAMWLPGTGNQIGIALQVFLMIALGQYSRLRHELRSRREQHAAETAVREERRRIAREMHDVVAHHISVINVLVGAGRTTMASDPARAQDVLMTAERTAREAMSEMRQLLHVLRAGDDETPQDDAVVGAEALPVLIDQASQAGLPARLDVHGAAVPLPSTVDHAVYRIVQESLTNTRKHAGGARASVRLSYLGTVVEVEVLDDGVGLKPQANGGFGLGGMAERVALCGGQLQTGPRPEGGFRVHARIPLPALQKEDQVIDR
jgi:signal transduction histidine kinase